MPSLSDDQRRRHDEFQDLFARLPGRNNVQRLRECAAVTGLSLGTLRQYRMAEPPRVPSEQVLRLMRAAAPSAGQS